MDISDISKVATRKRMNTDAEKLREKVSRETAKIIKLKVAQDTAYWDLKEKLQQLEANHERLQQNMVEVQMQHEAISGQYQEELRLRPDTLNKLGGTRDICDVLEDYGERLRRTVSRCRADQQALQHAYGACGARVRRLALDATQARELARVRAAEARSAVERHEADARRVALTAEQLGAVRARCDLMEEVRRELAEKLERYAAEMRQHEESAAATQAEVVRLQRALDAKSAEVERVVAEHEAQMQATRADIDKESALRRHAEQRLAQLQELLDSSRNTNDKLTTEYQEASAVIERLSIEVGVFTRDKERLEAALNEREQRISTSESELQQARERASTLQAERAAEGERLQRALHCAEREAERAEQLARRARVLQVEASQAVEENASKIAEANRMIEDLRRLLTERERELDTKTDTITKLMGDLKSEAEARNRSEASLATVRQQYDTERTANDATRADLNATIQRLETSIHSKDEEITSQKNVIQEIRSEKERLQERIRAMQSTINNIQQELTGRVPPPPAPAPERERDAMLYSYLSDGSVDSDALDAMEVNRRFEALSRGERPLPPLRVPRSHSSKKSLSQSKKESKLQSRRFFKSKLEAKINKLKE